MSPARPRRALVIGCAGQDGSYLCELLLDRGYEVLGITRGRAEDPLPNLDGVRERITVRRADLRDGERLGAVLADFSPSEVYNFASVTFGPDAWSDPVRTVDLGTVALVQLLELIRTHTPEAAFFQASSSWVFGQPATSPQDEHTPLRPVEPYGAAKAFGNNLLAAYRDKYALRAAAGIFFNHESPRRPERFVTRKITSAVARIRHGLDTELSLGGLDSRRDWGYARDYVEAAWLSLQQDVPQDVVIATGELHTVRDFVERAFDRAGLDWQQHVRYDAALARRGGVVADLVGDPTRARETLGWTPTTTFEQLVDLMVDHDVDRYAPLS